ncbi:MAG: exosome complex exonuclease Rrp41 [Candidatus Woesearchaeota archaeon]|nr:exosome complex exonuclease Rrp41 [Candidatus Woesearchaeota archaeon]MDP7199040.1 exosome complex exonuclease Rrp41 [Candidatus Woesearchaeota archaeon]MDP7467706.1 exosome complex exonuclease Rrp41 [Candidatus Woesearchaeota archaeon]MDP7646790.1 exosome complex exonuclease Rrp41 [Candidatus Woesearchaeota archaeon]
MSYDKRFDGRQFQELRKMEAKVGVVPSAQGSAMFKIGNTVAIAAVRGPREVRPRFMQDPTQGLLRCHYNMMPFSGHGDRVRPGGGRRSKEISMIMEQALRPVINLQDFPNAMIEVFVELPQTDAGTRCAGITAAAMALAHAGYEMKDLVTSVALGKVGNQIVADVNYDEEAYEGEGGSTDIPIAIVPSTGEVTLLQLDGEVTQEDLKKVIELGTKAAADIFAVQQQALKDAFKETA